MLFSVLRSDHAAQVNIQIMRTFAKLRSLLATHEDLARKVDLLEGNYDRRFKAVLDAIRELRRPDPRRRHRIGFGTR